MTLAEEDSKQLAMYRKVKELMQSGRITLLQSSETQTGGTISIELTKTGKSIGKIRSELNNGYFNR